MFGMRSTGIATLSLLLLASCTSAVVTTTLNKVRNNAFSGFTTRDRVQYIKSREVNGGPPTIPATSQVDYYTTSISIGNPPTTYNLFVDTASSNVWCGGNGKLYNQTSTSIATGQSLNISYGSGNLIGMEYLDQLTLAPNFVITNQSIGNATELSSFQNIDGVIGFGPVDLTTGTLSSDTQATVPTVMNNLVSQGLIEKQVIGIYFAPSSKNGSDTNSALTFGGTDRSFYEGEVTYVSLTNTYPSSRYWGVNVTSVRYGNNAIISDSTAGILDAGTTQILFSEDSFNAYMHAIPGAKYNESIGLIEIPSTSVSSMQPLDFAIDGSVFTLDVAAQLFPDVINTGGPPGVKYSVIGSMGFLSQEFKTGLSFILGQAFMERYYVVLDSDDRRIGFAKTKNTFSSPY